MDLDFNDTTEFHYLNPHGVRFVDNASYRVVIIGLKKDEPHLPDLSLVEEILLDLFKL